jgi:carbamoyltransferase
MKTILGLNISGFHSSACLVIDGEVKFAITEERVTRVKQDKSFPKESIEYCCNAAGINKSDITDIYVGWNPAHYIHKSDNTLNDAFKDRGKLSYLTLNELSVLNDEEVTQVSQQLKTLNSTWNIHFVNHHHAHLSNAFLTSGFKTSDFFVGDGFGENTTGCVGSVNLDETSINTFNSFNTPHSLGSFYSSFTEFLGFKPNGDEWKVMALASLGDSSLHYEKVKNLIKVNDLNFELDLSYFEHYLFFTKNYFSEKFIKEFGEPVEGLKGLTQYHYDLVASVQRVAEEVAIEILKNLHKKTNSKNIVVSGGFFMNSVLNGVILEKTPYENIYIGGSPDDSGISIGSALYGLVFDKESKLKLTDPLKHNYFGKEYSNEDIIEELEKRKIKYNTLDEIESFTAEKIRDKNIIGWFQGKSEFGQRALGNRSILADPTKNDIKDIVNSSIKYREGFRPFAPSVLEEKQNEYFTIPKNQNAYFMEKVFKFKSKHKDELPAVVHFDGSGRLQTVSKKINPKYHKLITEFEKLSGHPVLLNTSFNVNGMPLVETPADAINCFYQSGIDYLIMNNIVISK